MGFNKRWVNLDGSIYALEKGNLKEYYGNCDAIIFQDKLSETIYDLFTQNKTKEEILLIINQNK